VGRACASDGPRCCVLRHGGGVPVHHPCTGQVSRRWYWLQQRVNGRRNAVVTTLPMSWLPLGGPLLPGTRLVPFSPSWTGTLGDAAQCPGGRHGRPPARLTAAPGHSLIPPTCSGRSKELLDVNDSHRPIPTLACRVSLAARANSCPLIPAGREG